MSRIRKIGEKVLEVSAGITAVLVGAIPCLAVLYWLLTIEDLAWWILLPAIFVLTFGAGFVTNTAVTVFYRVVDSLPANRRAK